MKKYKINAYSIDIVTIEIEKETEKTVFIRIESGRLVGERKISSWYKYFGSFEDARDYLINRHTERIDAYRLRIADAESNIEKLKVMKEK